MPLSPGVLHKMATTDYGYGRTLTINDLDWLRKYQCMRQAREMHSIMVWDGLTVRSDEPEGIKLAARIAPLLADICAADSLYVSGFPEWARGSDTVLSAYAAVRLTEWASDLARHHKGSDHGPFCDTCVSLANCLTVASMVDTTRYELFRHMAGVPGEVIRYSFMHAGHLIITSSINGPVWSVKCVTCGVVSSVDIYSYSRAGTMARRHQGEHALPAS